MPFIVTHSQPAIKVYYQDTEGSGAPVVLIHGWPASHKMWEPTIGPLVDAGHRVIAYDRRGFGNSSKPWSGYDYDTFAHDLHDLLTTLDLHDATLVGFSMGGGEVARYLSRYGTARVARVALVAAVTPFLMRTADNPEGADPAIFDGMREKVREDRLAFLAGFLKDFYGVGTVRKPVSQPLLDYVFSITAHAQPHATYECIGAFSETDFREDLKAFTVPTLVVHGDADAIVPREVSGDRVAKLLPDARYEVIEGGPHGLNVTHADAFNEILLDFLKGDAKG